MFLELYYKDYAKHCQERYWEEDKKSLPYLVKILDKNQRERFCEFLASEGFKRVCWSSITNAVLVNMEYHRFGNLPKPVSTSRVDNRNYTLEEFMNEVYYTHKR